MQPRLDPFTDVTPNPGLNNQLPRLAQSKSFGVMAAIAALTLVSGAALAQSAPRGTVTPAFREAIPNIPGKSIVAVVVSYPPGWEDAAASSRAFGLRHGLCAVRSNPQSGG